MKYKSIPLPLNSAAARREACNGSHKLLEKQCAGLVGGGDGAARGVQCSQKLGERNNAPTLKIEKWKYYGVILVMQLCCG